MRCSICDYSPEAESPFYDSLANNHNQKRLYLAKNNIDVFCDDCYTNLVELRNDYNFLDPDMPLLPFNR